MIEAAFMPIVVIIVVLLVIITVLPKIFNGGMDFVFLTVSVVGSYFLLDVLQSTYSDRLVSGDIESAVLTGFVSIMIFFTLKFALGRRATTAKHSA